MPTKIFKEIQVNFPSTAEAVENAFQNCEKRNKFIEVDSSAYLEHLELAKDDLNALEADFKSQNWRWVVTKSYYSIFHATNALLVNKQGFFSKDHLCAVIALKKRELIPQKVYLELGEIYDKFSDIFGFAVLFEARKLSQYDTKKWKEINKEDAEIARNFAKKFVSFVEEECQ